MKKEKAPSLPKSKHLHEFQKRLFGRGIGKITKRYLNDK